MSEETVPPGVKKQVLDLPAYSLKTYAAEVKLNQNENPYDFPEDLKEEILRKFQQRAWSRYPDFVPDELRARIGGHVGWQSDGVLVGNGSNELLQAVLMTIVGDGTPVALPSPTFAVYGLLARVLGGTVVNIPLTKDLQYDVDSLIELGESANARIMVICNPNNPTGSVLEEEDIGRILDRFRGYLLLDEAYYEFCGRTGFQFLRSCPRLIITRTFSKAMGMAGLRVGYLLADPALVTHIAKAKLPYNLNQFSLIAAQVALANRERFQPAIEAILRERARLEKELQSVDGVRVFPTGANFFLLEVPADPRTVFQDLMRKGVLVRDVSSYPMLSRCLRVSVGTPRENDRFLDALRDSLRKASTMVRQDHQEKS